MLFQLMALGDRMKHLLHQEYQDNQFLDLLLTFAIGMINLLHQMHFQLQQYYLDQSYNK